MEFHETVDPREAFKAIGQDIDRDIKADIFGMKGTESVSWLMKEPHGAEEILMNAYERFRSLGITLTMEADKREVSVSDVLKAMEVRMRSGNTTLQ